MDSRQLEKKLGMAPGNTLTSLVELAQRVSPSTPWNAFAPLWLGLPWLEEGIDASTIRRSTPTNVHPFAETGGDGNHFGFLLDGDTPTDDRPIVFVAPRDDEESTQIVAPNLRGFLGLVAVAFGEVVSRDATDADWAGFRHEWYGDDPARLAEMERLSALLGTIPGVARPISPSNVANAFPNQDFELVDEEGGELEVVAPQLRELGDRVGVARSRIIELSEGLRSDGRALGGPVLAAAKHEATVALIAALDALAAFDESAAIATALDWRREPMLWKALCKGASSELGQCLARYGISNETYPPVR